MPKFVILFAVLCAAAFTTLLYFAQSAATRSAPAYATWNTNPDGARLLYDGLQQAGFVRVSRQFTPVNIQKPQQATVLFLGVSSFSLNNADAEFFDVMEAAARRGNTLVIAVPHDESFTFKAHAEKTLLALRWGIRFVSDKSLFSTYPIVDRTWQPVSGPDGIVQSDVWQRSFGKGFITLVAGGQRLSNKSIATAPAARLLLYQLVSHHPAVVFEEAHLGIHETGSIVGLARHYHLQGLMLGFLLLAGMFIWSRSVSFPPPPPAENKPLLGSDTRALLTELMSRHLKHHLVSACVSEWNRTRGHRTALAVPAETNAVQAYKILQQSLRNTANFTL